MESQFWYRTWTWIWTWILIDVQNKFLYWTRETFNENQSTEHFESCFNATAHPHDAVLLRVEGIVFCNGHPVIDYSCWTLPAFCLFAQAQPLPSYWDILAHTNPSHIPLGLMLGVTVQVSSSKSCMFMRLIQMLPPLTSCKYPFLQYLSPCFLQTYILLTLSGNPRRLIPPTASQTPWHWQ